jgi:hypothetical protein
VFHDSFGFVARSAGPGRTIVVSVIR